MNISRRGFFTGLVKACAIIALAPQIAFGVRRQVEQELDPDKLKPFWIQTSVVILHGRLFARLSLRDTNAKEWKRHGYEVLY